MNPVLWDAYVWFKAAGIVWFAAAAFLALGRLGVPTVPRTLYVAAILLGGLIGSKSWYVIQHLLGSEPYAYGDPLTAWNEAGSVLYGWILGGSVAVWAGAGPAGVRPLAVLDAVLPPFLVAQILNRFGCLAAGCCWGKGPCALPWAILNENAGNVRVHPVQGYEALWDGVLLAFLLRFGRPGREGWVTRVYFGGYALGRFFLEFWRGDNEPVGGLTVPQWTSLIILFVLLITTRTPAAKKNQLRS